MSFMNFHILAIITPTEELIFFREVGIPPTRYITPIGEKLGVFRYPYANHGAGICTPTFAGTKSPSFVGKYTSTMVRIWVSVSPTLFAFVEPHVGGSMSK